MWGGRNTGAHTRILALAKLLTLSKVPVQHHAVVRPLLKACFAFLAAFVHRNAVNQIEVWKERSVLEANVGEGVDAEIALAEVSVDM